MERLFYFSMEIILLSGWRYVSFSRTTQKISNCLLLRPFIITVTAPEEIIEKMKNPYKNYPVSAENYPVQYTGSFRILMYRFGRPNSIRRKSGTLK